MSDWWTTTSGPGHEQGDLLRDFPAVRVDAVEVTGDTAAVSSRVEFVDGISVTVTSLG